MLATPKEVFGLDIRIPVDVPGSFVGVGVKNFVPSLESLFPLGFEGGMSQEQKKSSCSCAATLLRIAGSDLLMLLH